MSNGGSSLDSLGGSPHLPRHALQGAGDRHHHHHQHHDHRFCHQGITVLDVCVVHEVVVAQKLRQRDWLPLLVFITIIDTIIATITIILTSTTINMRDHYPGKSALPDWVKLSAQRFVLLGFTGVALMLASRQESLLKTIIKLTLTLARLHIMGSTLPVFTRFDNPAAVSESPTKQLTKPNLVTINWWLQHCITIIIFTSQVWLTGGDFTRFAISLASVPHCYNILQAPGNAASGISWLH